MFEKARFLGVGFQQKDVAQGTMNFERQARKTRSRAYIEETPLLRQKRGREKGIKEKLNDNALPVL
jgi:hypothetical protein